MMLKEMKVRRPACSFIRAMQHDADATICSQAACSPMPRSSTTQSPNATLSDPRPVVR